MKNEDERCREEREEDEEEEMKGQLNTPEQDKAGLRKRKNRSATSLARLAEMTGETTCEEENKKVKERRKGEGEEGRRSEAGNKGSLRWSATLTLMISKLALSLQSRKRRKINI